MRDEPFSTDPRSHRPDYLKALCEGDTLLRSEVWKRMRRDDGDDFGRLVRRPGRSRPCWERE